MEPISEQSGDEVELDVASVGSRLGARAIDALIGVATYVLIFVFVVAVYDIEVDVEGGTIDAPGGAVFLISYGYIIIWGWYEIVMTRSKGQTLGKSLTKIKVISSDGSDQPTWGNAALRWIVLAVPMVLIPLPISALILLLVGSWFIWDKKGRGWQDKAANTYVVKAPPNRPPA